MVTLSYIIMVLLVRVMLCGVQELIMDHNAIPLSCKMMVTWFSIQILVELFGPVILMHDL